MTWAFCAFGPVAPQTIPEHRATEKRRACEDGAIELPFGDGGIACSRSTASGHQFHLRAGRLYQAGTAERHVIGLAEDKIEIGHLATISLQSSTQDTGVQSTAMPRQFHLCQARRVIAQHVEGAGLHIIEQMRFIACPAHAERWKTR